ncbi:uncharacterized protein LOC143297876 [Babylonia areolata]|uniref:uncharacterized protein LOC143297876 n=1 Tax=Babylonia areolata TaxID=304850 RepID=UPI003FD19BCD
MAGMMNSLFPVSFEESNNSKKDLIKTWIYSNIDYSGLERRLPVCFKGHASFYHIELPDFQKWPPEFKTMVFRFLVDEDVKEDLERAGLINWCSNAQAMVPLSVPKDGNCLLHSVATAIWGVTDRGLMVRRLLGVVLGIDIEHRFMSRWRHYQQEHLRRLVDRPVTSDPESLQQFQREWTELTRCLDPDQGSSRATPHRFLEAIHVYTLANILRRPIVVVTDPTLRTFSGMSLQDNDMGGIYLPLEWPWEDTWQTPVILAYTHCHFSPLVAIPGPGRVSASGVSLVPLVNRHLQQLPVRFLLQGEGPLVGELLRRYLKVQETVMQVNGQVQNILCAELKSRTLPEELSLVSDYFRLCQTRFSHAASGFLHEASRRMETEKWQGMRTSEYSLADPTLSFGRESQVQIPSPSFTPRLSLREQSGGAQHGQDRKCVVPTCRFFGDPELRGMCSRCFQSYSIKESREMAAAHAARPAPTAPLPTLHAEPSQPPMSMMTERCRTPGCGFRCSTSTHPYCHECAEKLQRKASEVSSKTPDVTSGGTQPAPSSVLPPVILNDLNKSTAMATAGSHFPQVTGAIITSQGVPQAGQTEAAACGGAGGKTADYSSPTKVLEAGSLFAPLTPPEDGSDKLLFGSGHPSPPAQLQTHATPNQPVGQSGLQNSSEQAGFEAGTQEQGPGGECSREGCLGKAALNNLCSKCYIGKGMPQLDPKKLSAVEKLKSQGLLSLSSSAPPSVALASRERAAANFPSTREAETAPTSGGRKHRSSSCTRLSEQERSTTGNLNHVQEWLNESGRISEASSFPSNQQMGLPEKEETELRANDLIMSGECGSPPHCIGEGCQNTVQTEGTLCQQCREILRQFRQGQGSVAPVQVESQPDQLPCKTEGCPYYGFKDNFYFCSGCYGQLFKRELEVQQTGRADPASSSGQRHTFPLSRATPGGSSTSHVTTPAGRQGVPCCFPGCTLYGDPKQAGRCSMHYQLYLNQFSASPVGQGQGQVQGSPSPAAAAGYQRVLDSLAMQTASLGNQHELSRRHPVQVAEPAVRSAPTNVGSIAAAAVPSSPVPQFSQPGRWEAGSPLKGEDFITTYNRVAGLQAERCLNPACMNFGNPQRGGVCNTCALDEELTRRLVLGEEQTG